MLLKLFVFGLPGSGKSTIARHIVNYLERKQWPALHISDYDILYKMYLEDTEHEHFYSTEHKGFYVHKPFIYDKAIKEVEKKVGDLQRFRFRENELVIIEFARSDYVNALRNFTEDFLQHSYFLFLTAGIETCKRRVDERIKNPVSIDDHFVSTYTFEYYLRKDSIEYALSVFSDLKTNYGVSDSAVKIIDNNGTEQDAIAETNTFIDVITEQDYNGLDLTKNVGQLLTTL